MIKAKVEGSTVDLSAQGSVVDLASDVAYLMKGIYDSYSRNGQRSIGEMFRLLMEFAASPCSPVWRGDTRGEGVMICAPADAVRGKENDDVGSAKV